MEVLKASIADFKDCSSTKSLLLVFIEFLLVVVTEFTAASSSKLNNVASGEENVEETVMRSLYLGWTRDLDTGHSAWVS